MEQTLQEAVQAGATSQWNWLQVIAAFGTVISAITLTLAVIFYIRDGRTRSVIRVEVPRGPEHAGTRDLVVQVVNTSRMSFRLDQKAFLGADDPARPVLKIDRVNDSGITEQGGDFKTYVIPMAVLRTELIKGGYQDKDTVPLYFAVHDGTGKGHVRPIVVEDLQDPEATTVKALPFPWHKRWAWLIRRWFRHRRNDSA